MALCAHCRPPLVFQSRFELEIRGGLACRLARCLRFVAMQLHGPAPTWCMLSLVPCWHVHDPEVNRSGPGLRDDDLISRLSMFLARTRVICDLEDHSDRNHAVLAPYRNWRNREWRIALRFPIALGRMQVDPCAADRLASALGTQTILPLEFQGLTPVCLTPKSR